jgi:hypothetical protein
VLLAIEKTAVRLENYRKKVKELQGENVSDIAPQMRGWVGKHITQKDDLLTNIEPQQLYSSIRQPDEAALALINRLRIVKTSDKKQYGVMKRELTYVV